jgi:hypothetical protein
MKTKNESEEMALSFGRQSKQSKVERYKWTTKDSPGEYQLIDKNLLLISPEYQREKVTLDKVRMVAQDWSWVACGTITVGLRAGQYWVIDGQHRVLGAKRRADIECLPCLVFDTYTVQEEAKGFLNVNTGRKPITSIDKFRAALAADDEIARFVQETFNELGVVAKATANNPKEIKALDWAIKRATENRGAFSQVLSMAAELCESMPIQNILLDGLYYIHTHTSETIYDKRIYQKIKKIGAKGLVDAAKRASAFFVSGGSTVWGTGMLEEINKGFREKIAFIK